EDGIRDRTVTGVQTCALPICVRLRGRGPAFRARVPRARAAAADLRRRRRGREAADDGLHERRAGEDRGVSPQGDRDIRAGGGERNVETMRPVRNAGCGVRSVHVRVAPRMNLHCNSAFRTPHSALWWLALLSLVTPGALPAP